MSLLDHLRSARVDAPPVPEAAPAPYVPPQPPVQAAPESVVVTRSARGNARNEALLEIKTRVHEDLIHELDPEQLAELL